MAIKKIFFKHKHELFYENGDRKREIQSIQQMFTEKEIVKIDKFWATQFLYDVKQQNSP